MTQIKQINNLYDLLDLIREKPGLYIGTKSITALWHFLHGFTMGVALNEGALKELEQPPFRHFNDWLAKAFDRSGGAASYDRILLSEALFKEWDADAAAFDMFFEFLDEFRKRTKVERAVIEFGEPKKSNFARMIKKDAETVTEIPLETKAVKIIEYLYQINEEGSFPYRYNHFKPRPEIYLTYEYLDLEGGLQILENRFDRLDAALQRGQEEFEFEANDWMIVQQ